MTHSSTAHSSRWAAMRPPRSSWRGWRCRAAASAPRRPLGARVGVREPPVRLARLRRRPRPAGAHASPPRPSRATVALAAGRRRRMGRRHGGAEPRRVRRPFRVRRPRRPGRAAVRRGVGGRRARRLTGATGGCGSGRRRRRGGDRADRFARDLEARPRRGRRPRARGTRRGGPADAVGLRLLPVLGAVPRADGGSGAVVRPDARGGGGACDHGSRDRDPCASPGRGAVVVLLAVGALGFVFQVPAGTVWLDPSAPPEYEVDRHWQECAWDAGRPGCGG